MSIRGWICIPKMYEFEGWFFEFGSYIVWPLKKDGVPRKRAGKKFWDMVDRFNHLTDDEKEKHRVCGGCIHF